MNLSLDQTDVLDALYRLEQQRFLASDFEGWSTSAEVAAQLRVGHAQRNNATWVQPVLLGLWQARRVLQMPPADAGTPQFDEVKLIGLERHGDEDGRLALEQTDVRGVDPDAGTNHQVVARYPVADEMRYRSRLAELARLLSYNYQRFQMNRGTGLLRYERREQRRPLRDLVTVDLRAAWGAQINAGELTVAIQGSATAFRIDSSVDRSRLAQACDAVLEALNDGGIRKLAGFQSNSVLATLAGLYSRPFRDRYDAHVVTAGVGSGKSYAFQIGALIHCAYCLLVGAPRGFRVLLLYPRVVLAANQFKDMETLIARVGVRLGIDFRPPVLDAGGQIRRQMPGGDAPLYESINSKYGLENNLILVSNLDTLANRLQHPEAIAGLFDQMDLIVGDEIHLMRGIYGAHARMLLERFRMMRALRQLRLAYPKQTFHELLAQVRRWPRAYFVGASATIAEPARHTARLLRTSDSRVLNVPITQLEPAGWVHHLFLRQKPEVSTMSALVNATACLVHNRRDGLFREYYQTTAAPGMPRPSLALDALPNPVQGGAAGVEPRDPPHIHKTLGFCDSLDGVGRWGDLVADNERTKRGLAVRENPGSYPYFMRFQEPLWRVPHQMSFAAQRKNWQDALRSSYGHLCRQCKKGVRCSADRVPAGLTDAGKREVEKLWSADPQTGSYLENLGVGPITANESWMAPYHQTRQANTISNLEGCPFFQTGLCWWWSMDHAGSNAAHAPSPTNPLNGVKRLRARADGLNHFVNSLRLQAYTSQSGRDLFSLPTINDIFQEEIRNVFRDRNFADNGPENTALVIGSPRLEVGVDLSRVLDGITYRAMRDPASLQQKVGRVGREAGADSVLVHLVTANTRDLYYFRNPQIALDPDYLQALPLHEDNRIVARHHLFMAIVDFLCLQGTESGTRQLGDDGERIWLINDRAKGGFDRWHTKVEACWDYLFGNHPQQAENLANLRQYLTELGGRSNEIENSAVRSSLTVTDSPLSQPSGAIDVFWHEFGPNLLQTPIFPGFTLSAILAKQADTAMAVAPAMQPRHRALLEQLANTQEETSHQRRSYLNNVFTQAIFRRGLPLAGITGNHPYVWTPSFYEAIGTETVRILLPQGGFGYESVSTAIGLLAPGTVSYRYGNEPSKVVVSSGHATGRLYQAPGFEAVLLAISNSDYFDPAACGPAVTGADLPPDFFGLQKTLRVFTPRQLQLVTANSQPMVLIDSDNFGMLADGDDRPIRVTGAQGNYQEVMSPPRCYSRRWFRLESSTRTIFALRFEEMLRQYAAPGSPEVQLPRPPVLSFFDQIEFEAELPVTDFVWGLDREFMSRNFNATRLVYQAQAPNDSNRASVGLGQRYRTPALVFTLGIGTDSAIGRFLAELETNVQSPAYQSLLWQVLGRYLEEHGQVLIDVNAPWVGTSPPSVFTVRNLRTCLIFHLLERWHPNAASGAKPNALPQFGIADVAACLAGANAIDQVTFRRICQSVAAMRNPPDIAQHAASLSDAWRHLEVVAQATAPFDGAYFRRIATDILLNSLSLSLHAAGLRQTGAEQEDLAYFYQQRDETARIFLFDTEAFGNGTVELIRSNLVIPSAERMLLEKLKQLGHAIDPLPSVDFAQCFQERLQECSSSQAAHLAFHLHTGNAQPWTRLAGERDGEKMRAGALYDFLRTDMGIASFDHLAAFRECPEFLAHLSAFYPAYAGTELVGQRFPAFQALESAVSFCLAGCVACLLSPETNLHGSIRAKDSVNKLLLDAFFTEVVVAPATRGNQVARVCYPGTGPGCTCAWSDHVRIAASTLGQAAYPGTHTLHLRPAGGGDLTVLPVEFQVTKDGYAISLRPDWNPVTSISPRVRVQMQF